MGANCSGLVKKKYLFLLLSFGLFLVIFGFNGSKGRWALYASEKKASDPNQDYADVNGRTEQKHTHPAFSQYRDEREELRMTLIIFGVWDECVLGMVDAGINDEGWWQSIVCDQIRSVAQVPRHVCAHPPHRERGSLSHVKTIEPNRAQLGDHFTQLTRQIPPRPEPFVQLSRRIDDPIVPAHKRDISAAETQDVTFIAQRFPFLGRNHGISETGRAEQDTIAGDRAAVFSNGQRDSRQLVQHTLDVRGRILLRRTGVRWDDNGRMRAAVLDEHPWGVMAGGYCGGR